MLSQPFPNPAINSYLQFRYGPRGRLHARKVAKEWEESEKSNSCQITIVLGSATQVSILNDGDSYSADFNTVIVSYIEMMFP
jgi:hypothetical protein